MRSDRHVRRALAAMIWLSGCAAEGDSVAPPDPPDPTEVGSVYLDKTAVAIRVAEVLSLKATAYNQSGFVLPGRTFGWSIADPTIAAVSDSGTIIGLAQGTTTVNATTAGKTGTAEVTVVGAVVSSVSVTPATLTVVPGANAELTATPRDAAGSPLPTTSVTWTSADTSIATVSPTGVVAGVGEGTTTITATVDQIGGTALVSVTSTAVATLEVTPMSVALAVGEVVLLKATPHATDGTALTGRVVAWISSNLAVVDGFANGDQAAITGLAPGVAVVTATSEGVSTDVTVAVIAPTANLCDQIAGAAVVANDGKYLGRLTNRFDPESIYNEFGTYGNRFSPLSIYNEFGTYGSRFSTLSSFNEFTTTPPRLVRNGAALAYFTVNAFLNPYVSPAFAETCNFP